MSHESLNLQPFSRAIILCLLTFAPAASVLAQSAARNADQTIPEKAPLAVDTLIGRINGALDHYYVFPEKAGLIEKHLESQLQKGAYKNITDPRLLAEKIHADIQSVHQDGHLRVNYRPGAPTGDMGPPAGGLRTLGPGPGPQQGGAFSLQGEKANNFLLSKVEVLDGNIGYLQINGFSGWIEQAKPIVSAAFKFLANTDALIIDLRNGGGGTTQMVQLISSYLFAQRTHLNDVYSRLTNAITEYCAEPALGENLKLSMPVYVLTSKRTFSAGEDFAYALQTTQRALVVGETSGGGAHPVSTVDVGQGFYIDVPHARSINAITKADWEGTGVIPNIPVPVEQALQKAQEMIFQKRLTEARTSEEKAAIEWSVTALKAHDYDEAMNPKAHPEFIGEYERFGVSARDGRFYLTIIANGRSYALRPISGNLFLVDSGTALQMEFMKNADGSLSLKFYGKPGAQDRYLVVMGQRDLYARR